MYRVMSKIPRDFNQGTPLVYLEDEYGGQSVISIDDGCFVLWNARYGSEFRIVTHWYKEAAWALSDYLMEMAIEAQE